MTINLTPLEAELVRVALHNMVIANEGTLTALGKMSQRQADLRQDTATAAIRRINLARDVLLKLGH